ncbi:MAG: DUF1203 domain-containing protein [Alphaproteobacteria bacterium]|nr:DUF1203 domain-containing protein [Alphaproteobacteria bacterium]
MSFRATGLALSPFEPLFALDDAELARRDMRRMVADAKPGFPCRVSLEDAEPGETLILLPFEHQDAQSPYRSSGAIFVRERAGEAFDRVDQVPPVLRGRLLSLRAYDGAGLMVDADIVEGRDVEAAIERFFARDDVSYLHVHNAKRGCYACRIDRA